MQFSLILQLLTAFLGASLVLANTGASLAGSSSKSGTGDHSNYIYFGADARGGGHSMLGNDAVIGQAMGWGVKFTFQKFNPEIRKKYNLSDPASFRIPSVAEYNQKVEFPQGTSVMLSCYDQALFNIQDNLNKQCAKDPKCKKDYIVAALWGTIGLMDFKKDGILLNACVLLQIDTSSDCGFPEKSSCHTKVVKDLTHEMNDPSVKEGSIVVFGPASSLKEVTNMLQEWATKNKQQITLPNGSITAK